jgi:LuxR family maltose regulon positive regulatory protein
MGLYRSWIGVLQTYQLDWFEFSTLDWWIEEFFELRRRYPDYPASEVEIELLTLSACLWYGRPGTRELWQLIERAYELVHVCADPGQRLLLANNVSLCCSFKGALGRNRYLVETLDPLREFQGAPPFAVNAWRFAAAMHHWMVGRARDCLEIVNTALSLSRTTGMHVWDFLFYAQGAYASLSLGDIDAAEGFLHRMNEIRRPQARSESGQFHYLSALLATQEGDLDGACYHAGRGLGLAENYSGPFTTAVTRIALATAQSLRGDRREADRHLAAARVIASEMDSCYLEWLAGMTEAVIADASGNLAEVEDKLRPALALDRRVGGHSLAAFCGPQRLARLYGVALAAGIEVEHVREMIRRLELVPPESPVLPETWPWPVRIQALGRFEISLADQPLQFTGKAQQKPLQLLKVLLAFGGRSVSENQIAAALWPDTEGDLASQAFATTLHRLRKLLGRDGALRLENHCLSLDARYVWVDVWAFERGVAEARTQSPERLAAPLRLYQGPLFVEEAESWVLTRREHLRTLYLREVERLGTFFENAARWDAAAEWYLRAIGCHPLTESLHRGLMRSYVGQGRRAEALTAYQHCRHILLKDLGVSPSRETQALYRSLLLD